METDDDIRQMDRYPPVSRDQLERLRAQYERAERAADHWKGAHDYQVKVKQNLSANYGRALRARHAGFVGKLRKLCGR